MTSGVRLRSARVHEAEMLTELAMRAKAHWGYSEDFMAACRDELTVTAAAIDDPVNHYHVATMEGHLAGFYGLVPFAGDTLELDGLFVEPTFIGTGIGRLLLRHACAQAAARGAESLYIQSDPNADAFYEAMGGVLTGRTPSASITGRTLATYQLAVAGRDGLE